MSKAVYGGLIATLGLIGLDLFLGARLVERTESDPNAVLGHSGVLKTQFLFAGVALTMVGTALYVQSRRQAELPEVPDRDHASPFVAVNGLLAVGASIGPAFWLTIYGAVYLVDGLTNEQQRSVGLWVDAFASMALVHGAAIVAKQWTDYYTSSSVAGVDIEAAAAIPLLVGYPQP